MTKHRLTSLALLQREMAAYRKNPKRYDGDWFDIWDMFFSYATQAEKDQVCHEIAKAMTKMPQA